MSFQLHHISHSAAQKFLACGERYRLERVEHHYGLPHMAAIGGSAFHHWTEEYDLTVGYGVMDAVDVIPSFGVYFAAALDEACEEHYRRTGEELNVEDIPHSRYEGEDKWLGMGERMTQDYVAWRNETSWKCVEVELAYEQELGLSVPAVGYIDREFIDQDGRRILVDLKSGKSSRIGGTPQLFEYAVIRRLQGVKIDLVAYYDARKGILLPLEDPSDHTVAWLKNYYGNVVNKINAGIFKPNPGIHCRWCGVKDVCAFAEGK